MLKSLATVAVVLTVLTMGFTLLNQTAPRAGAHCQVPCGIFDDPERITMLYEEATTIEKAMNQMNELADKQDAESRQQFVRWTNTKEDHASRIITVTSEYFLTQKIKPVAKGEEGYNAYLDKLALHHELMVAAMKSKQTTDPAAAQRLRDAIHAVQHVWDKNHAH